MEKNDKTKICYMKFLDFLTARYGVGRDYLAKRLGLRKSELEAMMHDPEQKLFEFADLAKRHGITVNPFVHVRDNTQIKDSGFKGRMKFLNDNLLTFKRTDPEIEREMQVPGGTVKKWWDDDDITFGEICRLEKCRIYIKYKIYGFGKVPLSYDQVYNNDREWDRPAKQLPEDISPAFSAMRSRPAAATGEPERRRAIPGNGETPAATEPEPRKAVRMRDEAPAPAARTKREEPAPQPSAPRNAGSFEDLYLRMKRDAAEKIERSVRRALGAKEGGRIPLKGVRTAEGKRVRDIRLEDDAVTLGTGWARRRPFSDVQISYENLVPILEQTEAAEAARDRENLGVLLRQAMETVEAAQQAVMLQRALLTETAAKILSARPELGTDDIRLEGNELKIGRGPHEEKESGTTLENLAAAVRRLTERLDERTDTK